MSVPIRVGGLQPLTTLDYPGHLACVIFCQGCAWRCQYCHNPDLIAPRSATEIPWDDVVAFLNRRQGLLQAVVFSGGEATLQPGLAHAMQTVRKLGFKVGLHTAGIKPAALAAVLPLCDWVGFDVKALGADTERITGTAGSGRANAESLALVLASGVEYEVRTTLHWQLLNPMQVQDLAQALAEQGVENYVLQMARSENILRPELGSSLAPYDVADLWQKLGRLFPKFELRRN